MLIMLIFFLKSKVAIRKIISPKKLTSSFLSDLKTGKKKEKKSACSKLRTCSQTFCSLLSMLGRSDLLFNLKHEWSLKSERTTFGL